ncbi:TetR/AcrR family transcriptional regulator [Pseudonocardia sp. WMMC193]|uniref:TetR/AcrR family transcriptional regulator n=1 Tax=Pseudonocardia sp. WMMC193 TaxID=2911965 RepID=UPI001F2F8CC9|nr:TetR/AcrR family transcriptional regulator [Pseudonocardia sp. WMMC193]MCF7547499.1 TetR/AcrR family transcriptional regulator [Pseudonocardia sp. WMMC193]
MSSASPPARRRAKRAGHGLGDVQDAALTLFARTGYRATGVRDIADALGIGPTSVYSHVRTKGELLREIVVTTLRQVLAGQRDAVASTSDPVLALRRSAESLVRYFLAHPRESIVTIRDFAWVDDADRPEITRLRHEYRSGIEEVLARGEEAELLVVEDRKLAAFAIIELCEAVVGWYRPDGPMSAERVAFLYGEYAARIAGARPS